MIGKGRSEWLRHWILVWTALFAAQLREAVRGIIGRQNANPLVTIRRVDVEYESAPFEKTEGARSARCRDIGLRTDFGRVVHNVRGRGGLRSTHDAIGV